jgi:hypothetical protein
VVSPCPSTWARLRSWALRKISIRDFLKLPSHTCQHELLRTPTYATNKQISIYTPLPLFCLRNVIFQATVLPHAKLFLQLQLLVRIHILLSDADDQQEDSCDTTKLITLSFLAKLLPDPITAIQNSVFCQKNRIHPLPLPPKIQ